MKQQPGDLSRCQQSHFILDLVQEWDQARGCGHGFAAPVGMRQHGRDHSWYDGLAKTGSGERCNPVGAMNMFCRQRPAQDIEPDNGHDNGRAGWDHRFVSCRSLEREPPRAIGLDHNRVDRMMGRDAIDESWLQPFHLVFLNQGAAGHKHLAVLCEHSRELRQKGAFSLPNNARRRA